MYSPSMTSFDDWSLPSYKVRVRGTVPRAPYLWGSAGITAANITFPRPLVLHIHNDLFGDFVTFGTQAASGGQTTIGTLAPGECVSIPLQETSGAGISGVFATCPTESMVTCLVRALN
jgi:hypothetical protein